MPKKWLLINLVWVFLTLSACGWQLRSNPLLANQFGTVHISYPQSQLSLAVELKRALRANNIELVGATGNANYQIKILAANQSRRISALNLNARASQYQIYQSIDYLITDIKGVQILAPTTASAETTYNFSELDVLAAQSEEDLLHNNLRMEIVRQILSRLGEASNKQKDYP
jgi:outer membrane lipopolysaccharide assembly protein LptE/RlpB